MKDEDEFVRDMSNGLINTNMSKFDRYKMQREKAVRDKAIASKVDHLEKEMSDIKQLLQQIHSRIT